MVAASSSSSIRVFGSLLCRFSNGFVKPYQKFPFQCKNILLVTFFFPRVVATLATIFGSVKRRITGSNSMMQVVCFSGKSYRQVHLILLMENGIRSLDLKIAIL